MLVGLRESGACERGKQYRFKKRQRRPSVYRPSQCSRQSQGLMLSSSSLYGALLFVNAIRGR
jgi:hypothetical protein